MQQVIIVTGLGDYTSYIRRAIKSWPKRYGLEPHIFAWGWEGEVDAYEAKHQNLLTQIHQLSDRGQKAVALIGISAGGSAVLNAARDVPDEVSSVVNICGRVRRGRRGLWSL